MLPGTVRKTGITFANLHFPRYLQCQSKMEPKRYFINNLPDYRGGDIYLDKNEHKQKCDDIVKAVKERFTKNRRNAEGGLYVGLAGAAYMLYRLSKHPDFQSTRDRNLQDAVNFLELPLAAAQQAKKSGHITDLTGFLTGSIGVNAVAAVVFRCLGAQKESDGCLAEFAAAAQYLKPINWFQNGGDELFVGRAGYLCGLLWLREELGFDVIPDNDAFLLLDTIIESGKQFSQKVRSPSPLMYHYYGTEYLGPAHGLSGILYILLSFPKWLASRPEAQNLIKQTIDVLLSLQMPSGNFPCAMDEVGGRRPSEDELVHWCHGAPGVIYLLARAYLIYKDDRYLQACLRCGEVTWQKGLLKKGPGICHGVAGSGYVFLVLYRLTANPAYLHRAVQFMNFMSMPDFRRARTPDSPESLYEGLAGTVCFAADLLQPASACYPFFRI